MIKNIESQDVNLQLQKKVKIMRYKIMNFQIKSSN